MLAWMSSSNDRLALNEAAFRVANERMASWEERARSEAEEPFYCECSDAGCKRKISLRTREYEAVRASSRRFFTVPGHEVTEIETVVERNDRYVVIEKHPDVTDLVRETDPRRGSG